MESDAAPLLLNRLTPAQVHEAVGRDDRLIVPLGACDQYGPHLPVGAATLIVDFLAQQLSAEFKVLCAPALPYGVNVPVEQAYPGSATLREKTYHSALNDLLAAWEDQGFREFILVTVHSFDSHVEAAATVTTASARVRVIELLNMDMTGLLSGRGGPEHGGEAFTALMLHLYPDLVQMELAVDFVLQNRSMSTLRRVPGIPAGSAGSLGEPSRATSENGRRLYEHILEKIRSRVFATGAEGA